MANRETLQQLAALLKGIAKEQASIRAEKDEDGEALDLAMRIQNQNELIGSLNSLQISKDDLLQALSQMRIESPEVKVPEIVIPKIDVPVVNIPPIEVPEANVNVQIPEIKVPTPEVTVNVPEFPDIPAPIVNITEREFDEVGLRGVDANNPLPVILRDLKGAPVTFGGGSTSGGASGAPQLKDIASQTGQGREFFLEVSKGNVRGHSIVNKFGQNDDLNSSTYEDIWDGGGTYSWPSTALITNIVSTKAADSTAVEVQGLDSDGSLCVQETTLNGTTKVDLPIPLWRVFRMKNAGAYDFEGDVTADNTGETVTYAKMAQGNNQTLMCLYTIPKGKTGYLVNGTASISDNNRSVAAGGRFLMRPFGGVFQLKNTFGVTDTNALIFPFPLPGKIPEKTDMRVECKGDAGGVVVNATFAVLLVDN